MDVCMDGTKVTILSLNKRQDAYESIACFWDSVNRLAIHESL